MTAIGSVYQAGAGQPATATCSSDPGQQAGANDGAADNRDNCAAGAHRWDKISTHLHNQQPHPQAEPQRGVLMPAKHAV